MSWIIEITSPDFKERNGLERMWVMKIGKDNKIQLGSQRDMAKVYKRKELPEKTVSNINAKDNALTARLIEIPALKVVS